MQALPIDQMAPGSACAVVMRGSATVPQYLLAAGREGPVWLACWRRHRSVQRDPVRLPEHVLSYCIAGHARGPLEIDGVRYATDHHQHAAFFLPAGSTLRWTLEAPLEMQHLHLYIAPQALPAGPCPPPLLHDAWLDGCFALLAAEQRAGGQAPASLLQALLPPLLAHLARLGAAPHPPQAPRVSPLRPFILRRVEAHVQAHLADRLRLPTLAALAGLSVDHFVRAFHKATGLTPHQWLLAARLDAAATRLRETQDEVAAIARGCGFAGSAHFCAAFRRRHGMTPSAWRRGG